MKLLSKQNFGIKRTIVLTYLTLEIVKFKKMHSVLYLCGELREALVLVIFVARWRYGFTNHYENFLSEKSCP